MYVSIYIWNIFIAIIHINSHIKALYNCKENAVHWQWENPNNQMTEYEQWRWEEKKTPFWQEENSGRTRRRESQSSIMNAYR